jgi:hypothetical protein
MDSSADTRSFNPLTEEVLSRQTLNLYTLGGEEWKSERRLPIGSEACGLIASPSTKGVFLLTAVIYSQTRNKASCVTPCPFIAIAFRFRVECTIVQCTMGCCG